MANTISNFLVGIGFEYDDTGSKQIESGMERIKSKALILGAVMAGAFGLKALTSDFADAKAELGRFSDVFSGSANDIQALGNALATEGGSLDSIFSQLESIERLRAGLLVGDAGFIAAAGKAGIDTTDIEKATTVTEAYLALADQFQGLNQQERLNAASALGLDASSIVLLSKGSDQVEAIVEKFKTIRPVTDDMTQAAREFNAEWVEISQNIGGVADALSKEILPVITGITSVINDWFGDNGEDTRDATAALTQATFGRGDREAIVEATGLPAWLFTPISELADNATSGVGEGISDFAATSNINDETAYSNAVRQLGVSTQVQSLQPSSFIAGQAPQEPQRQSSFVAGQAPQQTQQINVNLELDGSTIDRRTIQVVNGMAQTAIDDLASSTGG